MQIDWITILAQVINFLILVGLLNHFLYKPILNVMKEREEKIKSRWEEADIKKNESEQEAEKFYKKNQEFEKNKEENLLKLDSQIKILRQTRMDKLRKDVDSKRKTWLEELERERQATIHTILKHNQEALLKVLKNSLMDLANFQLEEQITMVFLNQLKMLAPAEREKLIQALRESKGAADVHTSFVLQEEQKKQIVEILKKELIADIKLEFKQKTEIICGIELWIQSRRLGWSFRSYLSKMEKEIIPENIYG